MTDSRAALEEAAKKWAINDDPKQYADFAESELEAAWRGARLCDDIALDQPLDKIISEVQADRERLWAENRDLKQESSSLKLLLSALFRFSARAYSAYSDIPARIAVQAELYDWHEFPVELDSSGIPVITPEIIEALEAAQ